MQRVHYYCQRNGYLRKVLATGMYLSNETDFVVGEGLDVVYRVVVSTIFLLSQ